MKLRAPAIKETSKSLLKRMKKLFLKFFVSDQANLLITFYVFLSQSSASHSNFGDITQKAKSASSIVVRITRALYAHEREKTRGLSETSVKKSLRRNFK